MTPIAVEEKPKVEKTLTLSEKTLSELTTLLSRNIASEDDLLRAARNLATLNINGSNRLTLDGYLLNRLHSRCHPTQDFPTFVRERIVELLSGYCGC